MNKNTKMNMKSTQKVLNKDMQRLISFTNKRLNESPSFTVIMEILL